MLPPWILHAPSPSNAPEELVRELAMREGMKTLQRAGMIKAKTGLTSLDEVLRVSG